MNAVAPAADSVTIANGASLSGALILGLRSLFALELPAAWTTAAVTFAVSRDGTTYVPLNDVDGEVTIGSAVAVASAGISVDPVLFAGWSHVKVRSGTSASPVNQGGARVVGVGVRETV